MSQQQALDRRLRPIYDAIDANNWKLALQQCNKGLAKHPGSPPLLALKGLTVLRSGKLEEALQLADEVWAEISGPAAAGKVGGGRPPVPDAAALSTAGIVYRELHRQDRLVEMYQAAHSLVPANQELFEGLFSSLAHMEDLPAMQRLAMAAKKRHGPDPFLLWAVTATVLQAWARANDVVLATPMTSSQLLHLAESMLQRELGQQPNFPLGYDAFMLYLDILQARGQGEAALKLVTGERGAAAFKMPQERLLVEASLLCAQGRLELAAVRYRSALFAEPDNWAVLQMYLNCLLPATAAAHRGAEAAVPGLDGGLGNLARILFDSTASEPAAAHASATEGEAPAAAASSGLRPLSHAAAHIAPPNAARLEKVLEEVAGCLKTLQVQVDVAASSGGDGSAPDRAPSARAPYLGEVELAARRMQLGLGGQQAVAQALLAYFQRFGHLMSCASDVREFARQIRGEAAVWLGAALQTAARAAGQLEAAATPSKTSGSGPATQQQLQLLRRHVCALQIEFDLGLLLLVSPDQAVRHAETAMELFRVGVRLGAHLDERERGPADELVDIAVYCLLQGFALTQDMTFLLQALLVVEAGAVRRKYSASMRLAGTALSGLLAAPERCYRHFRMLDIKHIQIETLACQCVLPFCLAFSHQKGIKWCMDEMRDLHFRHWHHITDMLVATFRNGAFCKSVEFLAFKHRLRRAHNLHSMLAEAKLLKVAAACRPGAARRAGGPDFEAALSETLHERGTEEARGCGLPQGSRPLEKLLRFNDDLSVRPCWLPPFSAPPSLAPAQLWDALATPATSAAAKEVQQKHWWSHTAASEGPDPAAALLRSARSASLSGRHAALHVLQAAVAGAGEAAAASARLQRLLPSLLRELHPAQEAVDIDLLLNTQVLQIAQPPSAAGGDSARPPWQLARDLSLAFAGLTASVLQLRQWAERQSGGGGEAAAAPADEPLPEVLSGQVNSRAGVVARLLEVSCHRAMESLVHAARNCPLLPGGPLALLNTVLQEDTCWVLEAALRWEQELARLQKAAKRTPSVRSRAVAAAPNSPKAGAPRGRRGQAPASAAAAPQVQADGEQERMEALCLEAAVSLARMRAGIARSLRALLDSLREMLVGLAHEKALARLLGLLKLQPSGCPSDNSLSAAMWGWETGLDARAVLSELLCEQRSLLLELQTLANGLARGFGRTDEPCSGADGMQWVKR